MNGPDSISDPVARKISHTGSYPSARGSTPTWLGSARLAADDVADRSHCATVSADMACQLAYWRHEDAWHAWGASKRVGSLLISACERVRPCPTYHFCVVFTSMLVSSFFSQWYGQNTILTTFIFWQKSNTTLNHKLWYQLLGIPTGDVLLVAHWRLSTLTHYLTWFGKSPTSRGEINIIRYR